jgi:hypothetical protein
LLVCDGPPGVTWSPASAVSIVRCDRNLLASGCDGGSL